MEIQKYDYIDALRGWAIIGVIFSHLFEVIRNNDNFFSWLLPNFGSRGVQLFFMISACTLFLSLDSRRTKEEYPTANFFIRRFFRIAPLFYLAILYYLLTSSSTFTLQEVISVLTFTNGWNPYWINHIVPGQWTLAVEAIFYLFVPLLFMRIKNVKHAIIGVVALFVASGLLVIFFSGTSPIENLRLWERYMYRFPLSQIHYFFLGIILYFLIRNNSIKNDIRPIRNKVLLSAITLLPLAFLIKVAIPNFAAFYHILVLIESLMIFLGAIYIIKYPLKFFINRITIFIGKISYSIYLMHFIILGFLIKSLGPILTLHGSTGIDTAYLWTLYTVYFLIGTLVLSTITYYTIEQPGQLAGKYLIKRIAKQPSIAQTT